MQATPPANIGRKCAVDNAKQLGIGGTDDKSAHLSPSSPTLANGAKAARRDPRGRFPPGSSGNPAGRPKGRRNRVNQIIEQWADEHLAQFLTILPSLAVNDSGLMKFVLDRMTPKEWRPAPDFVYGDLSNPSAINCTLRRAFAAHDAGDIDRDALEGIIDLLTKAMQLCAAQEREEARVCGG